MEHKPSSTRDYLLALFIAAIFFVILGAYLYVRRGYMWDAPATAGSFYVPNKVVAGTAVMMLALVFLIGPVARYFDRFDHWLAYRKEIGIVGGFLAIMHGVISLWFVPTKFSAGTLFSGDHRGTALAGSMGALFLAFLIFISLKVMVEKIGGARWWFLQRWGLRLAVLFTLLHVIPMKWPGWVTWVETGAKQTPELLNPGMTPASLLVTLFLVWVVLIRLYESVFLFRDFGFKMKEIGMDAVLKKRGRRFFLTTLFLLVLSYGIVLGRWVV